MDLPHPQTPVRQVCLPFSHPQDKLSMLKPFTHNKTVIKQVTRPHINQVFQKEGAPTWTLCLACWQVGFFSGSFQGPSILQFSSTFSLELFHFSDSLCVDQKNQRALQKSELLMIFLYINLQWTMVLSILMASAERGVTMHRDGGWRKSCHYHKMCCIILVEKTLFSVAKFVAISC